MQCQILGPLRVIDGDGNDRTPGGAQQRSALTMLAARAPGHVSVDALEDVLWPAGAPSANALQALISKLRKVVAPGRIEGNSYGYSLLDVDTDVATFESLVADGLFDDADTMVRGEPLADLGDTPTATAMRARLDGIVSAARAKRLETMAGHDPMHAIADLQGLVASQPLIEDWWRLLMLAEYRSGRVADALRTYQRARATVVEQLGVEPGPELRDLERRMLDRDPELSATVASTKTTIASTGPGSEPIAKGSRGVGLPSRLSSFVGRVEEIESLAVAVRSHRLVTLVGPGGVGKTSTALELAHRAAPELSRWVDLAALDDRDAITRGLTRAIGLPESEQGVPDTIGYTGDGLQRAIDVLAATETVLVFDNCEHLIETIATTVHQLLTHCPDVRIIATSREPLSVPGEHVFLLPPLPPSDAATLLVTRAADHGADVRHPADAELIRSLCERLDGLPLAIELAAARLRTMTVEELLDGLADRFGLLSHGSRSVDERQRTLRAVVDWSHDLLDEAERVVFRRLSVFVGGCWGDAARAVCCGAPFGAPRLAPADIDDALVRLVDKSLVVARPSGPGMRFDLLETLRDYGHQRLVEAGELEATLVRHAQYFADSLQPALRGLIGHDQVRWLAMIGTERQNIEAAVDTALARDDAQLALQLTSPLGWYFFMTGELEVGGAMLGDALACRSPAEPELRALVLGLHGWLAANGPNVERAVATTAEAVGMLDDVHDPWTRGVISNTHAMAMFFAGRLEAVEQWMPDVVAASDRSGDPWIIAITRLVSGEMLQFRGDAVGAEREYLEAARIFDEVGDQFAYAISITEASEIAENFGRYDHAVELLERGITIAQQVGFSSHPSAMRARLGNIEILRGNLDIAEQQHRSLIDDTVASGVPWLQAMARFGLSMIARRRGRLDEAREHLDIAASLPRTRSVPYLRALLQVGQGYLADQNGDLAIALDHQRSALDTALQLFTPRGTAYALEGCAGALALAEEFELHCLGARLLGHADRLRRDCGGPMPAPERFDVDRAEHRLRGRLNGKFDVEFARGAASATADLVAAVRALPTFT